MSSITVTENQLVNTLKETNKSQKVGLSHRKPLDMYKKDNPFYGRVEVVQNLRGHINANYARSVQKATGNETFKAKKPAWGNKTPNSPHVEHKGRNYIQLKVEGRPGKAIYFLDGIQVRDAKTIREIEFHKKDTKNNEINIRCVPIDNLMRLTMGGTVYRVQRS